MANKKQTAVEWLKTKYKIQGMLFDKDFQQAKEIEKSQIIDANEDASTNELGEFLTGKQYYDKQYTGKQ